MTWDSAVSGNKGLTGIITIDRRNKEQDCTTLAFPEGNKVFHFSCVWAHRLYKMPAVQKCLHSGRKLEQSLFLLCFSAQLLAKHSVTLFSPFFPFFFFPGRRAHGTALLDCIQIKVIPYELQGNLSTHKSLTCLLKILKEPTSEKQFVWSKAEFDGPCQSNEALSTCSTGTGKGGQGMFGIRMEKEQVHFTTCTGLRG